jgi:hypothetical protein
MKKFLKQIFLFALPLFVLAMLLFSINPEKQFSYGFVKGECNNKASWIYNRIFLSDKRLDVAFIGASQTACAVNDELVEKKLSKLTGKTLKVASLGYCRAGRDIQYIMLKEIFRVKQPGVVIIEVTEDEPKKSHPVFPYLADNRDLVESAVFFNQRYLQSLGKGLIVRFEYIKTKLFRTVVLTGDSLADHGYLPTDAVAGEESLLENRKNWEDRLSNSKQLWRRNLEVRYSKHYLNKMVHLAEENGSRVIFLYLRESGSGLNKPMLNEYYTMSSEIIMLPEPVFTDPSNWSDATHFNDRGATLVSEKIATELAARIKSQPGGIE